MPMPKKDRTGERFISNEGCEFVIVEYNRYSDLWVEFQDEYRAIKHTNYKACQKGNVKNPYHPSVYGVGFLGIGEYESYCNDKQTLCYVDWNCILQRGFSKKFKDKCPTYKEVTVNPECFCFQDFAEWWHNNYYEIEGEQMCLDKDILIKGNKEYSFNTMIFVPQRINTLFIKCDASRGDLPIGVVYEKNTNKYMAICNIDGKLKKLGRYKTSHEAFLAYKTSKEQYIKEVADEYKDKIPKKLYDAMYAWTVEEDD